MTLDSDLVQLKEFSQINLNDPFFESLKNDYKEFADWFSKKIGEGTKAYILEDESGIQAFLYLKREDEELNEIRPPQPREVRLKVGTLKINAHGTKLGERFIKKIFDVALHYNLKKIYVTIFPKHSSLIKLFEYYGFLNIGIKETNNGKENVYERDLSIVVGDLVKDYPIIDSSKSKYILSIKPEYHTSLFPNSKLETEPFEIVRDVSHTNSIHKMYISFMDLSPLKPKDIIIVYRTSDGKGPAHYRSVATSICVVEEIYTRSDFSTSDDYVKFCESRSVFDKVELLNWYNRKGNLYILKMTYNASFKNRVTRKKLIEEVGLDADVYWGFFKIEDGKFNHILKLGSINESIIIN